LVSIITAFATSTASAIVTAFGAKPLTRMARRFTAGHFL